jgi:hypothetical protein
VAVASVATTIGSCICSVIGAVSVVTIMVSVITMGPTVG